MPVAEVRGARIAYDDTGGDGPPVILAHGFLMDRGMFAPQVEALRGTHRVITWDQRGFGDTEFDDQPFTYWDSAEDCLGLLDHLGVDRAVVGGMSQGGFVSLRAALLAPERVRGLVLLNTQAGTEDAEVIPLYEGLLAEWSTDGPSDDTCALVASIILGEPELAATYTARWKASPPAAIRQPGATLLGRDSIEDRLGEIAAPALVVHGDADAAIALPKAERLAAGLPDAELVIVAGGTHASNLTHPTEVNEAIVRFLSALPST
jgi:pimeloyl-ACP methyl ester carboxylesterase